MNDNSPAPEPEPGETHGHMQPPGVMGQTVAPRRRTFGMAMGITLAFTADEIRAHARERAGFHRKKAEQHREEKKAADEVLATASTSEPQKDEVRTRVNEAHMVSFNSLHQAAVCDRLAAMFTNIANRLPGDGTYQLSLDDVEELHLNEVVIPPSEPKS